MTLQPKARLEATVHGLVQGVSFRQNTLTAARRLGLVGWVANQSDGSVRIVAEGDEPALRQLLAFLHNGPRFAQVERVDSQWTAADGAFTEFRIRFS